MQSIRTHCPSPKILFSVHFGRLFIAPAHSFIRIPVFSFTLRGLPWWEFEGDKSETQSLHRSVRALLFLTHSRVSSAIAASNMSQGELRGNASAIPARNDSPAEILHSYPAASFSARRFIFGTSVQGPSWFYFQFFLECFSCSIAPLPILVLLCHLFLFF